MSEEDRVSEISIREWEEFMGSQAWREFNEVLLVRLSDVRDALEGVKESSVRDKGYEYLRGAAAEIRYVVGFPAMMIEMLKEEIEITEITREEIE